MTSEESSRQPGLRRLLGPLILITAGGTIFFLPFVLARIFRPTLLEVSGLTNFELGTAFSLYGVVAMVAYLPGGPLADAFSPRKLLATALFTTAAGGLVLAVIPSLSSLKLLYAYWGFTSIALFWAALMRATREWGGEMKQGAAFGLLDGGRGLLAAVTGPVMGYLLDRAPEPTGHQHVFWVVFGFAIAGLAGSVVFCYLTRQQPAHHNQARKLADP